ncbi:MAG TPA: DNA-binding response regulator [Desulfotomaculum sp.]|nr:MAG: Two component transcriptional regulator, winged helix family [Desulfotomaculum sp. 46_80]HAG10309.1 DNA-binding response regulator [Desulfotomaculum sp.]HBY03317.1 DNA-binding response regulator [Desulfotomaculum sp.]
MPRILVVDDEEHIVELVRFNLEREGFEVIASGDGDAALKKVSSEQPDLIILDLMLPGQDGLSVCRILRSDPNTRGIPVIILSARTEEIDRILGLEMGADDYVTKPFSPRELVARVKARLRRDAKTQDSLSGQFARGPMVIDPERFSVTVNGIKYDLTPKEFDLLYILAREPGRVFSREYLLERIWGYDYIGDSRTVDVHIRHIRQKLEQVSESPQFVETVRGVGYRFRENL